MIKCFTDVAWDDYEYWLSHDKKKVLRIHQLLKNLDSTPYTGIGKPEPLKHDLAGTWSRRIDDEHRLIYSCGEGKIIIYSCRYHYGR